MKKRKLKLHNIIPLSIVIIYIIHNIVNHNNIIINIIPILLLSIAVKIMLKDLIKNKKDHKKNIIELLK